MDEVLGLLKNLEDAARKDLSDLNSAWETERTLLEKVQEKAKDAYQKQVKECDHLESEQHALETKISTREDEISRNNQTILKDAQNIKKMNAERCKSNNQYIDHIVDHRDAVLLFGVLRKAIEGYTPGSFVQLENFHENVATLGDYINIYAK